MRKVAMYAKLAYYASITASRDLLQKGRVEYEFNCDPAEASAGVKFVRLSSGPPAIAQIDWLAHKLAKVLPQDNTDPFKFQEESPAPRLLRDLTVAREQMLYND